MQRTNPPRADDACPIRVAMIGGGPGAFIGAIHRSALKLAGSCELVAGCFSRSFEQSRAFGAELGIDPARLYLDWEALIAQEARLPPGKRAELIVVVTPNNLHVPVSKAALESGFHVVCEKPMARTLAEARHLAGFAGGAFPVFALAHTYLGYPMVLEMRQRIAAGDLGEIRRVNVTYTQGWLSSEVEAKDNKQAAWRTDPAISGPAGALGDIGTHASSLAEFVTGDRIFEVCADVTSFGAGRRIDDDAAILFRMAGGAKGSLVASQICSGEENALSISVYGTKAGMHWRQEEPNTLWLKRQGAPDQRIRAGSDRTYLNREALQYCRLPAGHPEGFIEALSNLYLKVFEALNSPSGKTAGLPGAALGLSTMAFVDAVLTNAAGEEKWTRLEQVIGADT